LVADGNNLFMLIVEETPRNKYFGAVFISRFYRNFPKEAN